MRITLDLDDELYEALRAQVGAKKSDPPTKVNALVKALVAEFHKLHKDKSNRYFVVEGALRQALEKVFGTTVSTADELVRRVQNLSRVGIGEVTRPLTDGESIQLAEQANFWGQKPADYIQTTVDRVLNEALGRV